MKGRARSVLVVSVCALSLALVFGCRDDAPDPFLATQDAGADTEAPEAGDDAPSVVDPTIGGPCNDDAQCDDQIDCTFDACDTSISRCRNTPDDTRCDDGVFCNGGERCQLRQGCVAGAVVTCQDDSPCTIDKCIETTRTCEHAPRDADGDGDPDDHCAPNHDCDDTDPTVNSTKQEVCGNFRDDNCNGLIDETPCTYPENDRCETAVTVTASSTLQLTTVAAKLDYPTTCASSITGAQDIVVAIAVPADGPKDVLVQATAASGNQVSVALESTCGSSGSEIQCASYGARMARAIARSAAAGQTIYAVVTTRTEGKVDVKVDLRAPTAHPSNETCAAPQPIALDTAVAFSLVDAVKDLAHDERCDATTGELTYAFTLSEKRDVRIYSSTTLGDGAPMVTLRSPVCADEAATCIAGAPLFLRSLAAGTYVVDVAAFSQIDGNLVVRTSPPTEPAPDESCATAPELAPNKTELVDLSNHERRIEDDCPGNAVNAARKLVLEQTSDVLLLARYALNETGTVALETATCPKDENLACGAGQSPAKASLRSVAPGDYRVVVGDQYGQSSKLIALVRPTVPPVTVASDTCADAATIPETGGFFTGDTSSKTADYGTSCDAANQPAGTAKDQVLKLTLTARRRVVFDMSGSEYNSLIDVRTGEPCPGVAVENACNPSFSAGRAFLDVNLNAGTYWVLIDGFGGATGKWNLDVRVLEPEP